MAIFNIDQGLADQIAECRLPCAGTGYFRPENRHLARSGNGFSCLYESRPSACEDKPGIGLSQERVHAVVVGTDAGSFPVVLDRSPSDGQCISSNGEGGHPTGSVVSSGAVRSVVKAL